MWLLFVLLSTSVPPATRGAAVTEFIDHAGASGTQHGKDENATDYWSSNSNVPLLPFITGFMGTHGTYRFLTVVEQTALAIGEPKHGMWRLQDSGYIREYRKKGAVGLTDGVDPNDPNLNAAIIDIIQVSYSHHLPGEGLSGYKYPDDRISNGKYDGLTGYLNFLDLSIYHPKYKGKYETHVAIDLPFYLCTLSQADYPHISNAWKYASSQETANKMGPLAKRAGVDIKENFLNVLQFDFIQDAGLWANVGLMDGTVKKAANRDDTKSNAQTVNYQRLDLSKFNVELYLIERLFYNSPYIFVICIFENKNGDSFYSYVRNSGAYWDGLQQRGKTSGIFTNVQHPPNVIVENYPNAGQSSTQPMFGLPVYGHHHPARHQFGLNGGGCPERGGDYGRYPWSSVGAGFPTNYEEITPICDGLLMDIKCWTNLSPGTWADLSLGLGNAAYNSLTVDYTMDANVYGRFTDPALQGRTNPDLLTLTKDGNVVEHTVDPKPDKVTIQINFTRLGTYLVHNDQKDIEEQLEKKDKCPEQACPKPRCPTPDCHSTPKCGDRTNTVTDNGVPGWGVALLVLCAIGVLLSIIGFLLLVIFREKLNKKRNFTEGVTVKPRGSDNHACNETVA